MEKKPIVTPEGWIVTEPDYVRFVVGHPPPRPYAYFYQLKFEARDWKVVALWVVGAGSLALGVSFSLLPLAFFAGVLLSYWLYLYYGAASCLRNGSVLTGEIDDFQPHPLYRDVSIAKARLPDGQLITVALPTAPAAEAMRRQGRAEVMLVSWKGRSGSAIGVRALPSHSADQEGNLSAQDR